MHLPPLARAGALIAGPILIAALLLLLIDRNAPDRGVFVEGERGVIFALSSHVERRGLDFQNLSGKTMVIPANAPYVFYVLAAPGDALAATPDAASVYRVVIDHASGATLDASRLPVTVHQINSRTIRVDPGEAGWGKGPPLDQYDRVLASSSASRATTDVVLAVVLPDPARGTLRIFPLRVGPP
jgi:hypothetical protein